MNTERDKDEEIKKSIKSIYDKVDPRRHTKIGRNDPCPCGSGKKYKKCCWNAAK